MFHCKKSSLFSLFSVLEFAPRAWHTQTSKPRLFLNGPLSFGVHCQAGWKEADVLEREFPSVCPQGDLTAVTLICQDTCLWRGPHLPCKLHSMCWSILDISLCLPIPVTEIMKWKKKVGSFNAEMWRERNNLLSLPLLELGQYIVLFPGPVRTCTYV